MTPVGLIAKSVWGLGDLMYDHVFVEDAGDVRYVTSRGGGTISNVLANVSSAGGVAEAIAAAGADFYGRAARDELHSLGVGVERVRLVEKRSTRLIFQLVSRSRERVAHTFVTTCLVCSNRIPDGRIAHIDAGDLSSIDGQGPAVLCVDRLTRDRVYAAHMAHRSGTITAMDLGRVGFLRYYPIGQILAGLAAFDFVSMPEVVSKSVLARARFDDLADLLKVGPRRCVCVTRGARGMTVLENTRGRVRREELEAPLCDAVVDDAGAGDVFFAEVARLAATQGDVEQITWSGIVAQAQDQIPRVLSVIGARGHLPARAEAMIPRLARLRGNTLGDLKAELAGTEECPFCGDHRRPVRGKPRATARLGARRNVLELFRRAFFAAERRDAVLKCQEIIHSGATAYLVGTGGSYPVAVFVSMVLAQFGKTFATPVRPFDYLRAGGPSDLVVVFSYSGSTIDCAEVIKAARSRGATVTLVSGVASPRLASLLGPDDTVISYAPMRKGAGARERGFVSIAGTVAPCALWTAAAVGPVEMASLEAELRREREWWDVEDVGPLAEAITQAGRVAVFGGGLAWPAVVDIESKFTEAGVTRVEMHEVKDFSHGRFVSLLNEGEVKTPCLLLGVGDWHPYEGMLSRILERDGRVSLRLGSRNPGVKGALELLLRVQFFAQRCGEALGRDISRPRRIPSAGLALYRWQYPDEMGD